MRADIAIVGAGPVGLSLARALSGSGWSIALIEKQGREALAAPAFDGRDIALTQQSVRTLKALGHWPFLAADEVSPLKRAKVLDGASEQALWVAPQKGAAHEELGFLVANAALRRAAFAAVADAPDVSLIDRASVTGLETRGDGALLRLGSGATLEASLVVAADSRFSDTRRLRGIGASMNDFGRTMLVCRMALERDHESVAWEWFGEGQTLALLPLSGGQASVVVTLPHQEAEALVRMPEVAFNADLARRFDRRLGAMTLTSTRHAYPLVAVYAQRFVAPRFACAGDAAVGMHPVTAHGFNFGLLGAASLARRLKAARRRGLDVADRNVLEAWEREHRAATRPLYLATNALARLYTDDTPPARLLRRAALHAGRSVAPFRNALAAAVAGDREQPPLLSRLAALPTRLRRRPAFLP